MRIYTVHEPAPRENEIVADPDRFRFVRDGFYFWAFLLGPVWMLWHRLWLVLLIYRHRHRGAAVGPVRARPVRAGEVRGRVADRRC